MVDSSHASEESQASDAGHAEPSQDGPSESEAALGPAQKTTGAPSWIAMRVRNLRQTVGGDPALWILLLGMVALGVFIRVSDLEFPGHMTFDEENFVVGARNYIAGERDSNDHPPLGKLAFAIPMKILGDNSFAWRLTPLIFGLAMIPLAFFAGRKIFKSPLAGGLAAAFVACDGLLGVYSRTALMDGLLLFFFVASAAVFVFAKRPWHFFAAALLAGSAGAVKFTGIVLVPPLFLAYWIQRKQLPWWTLVTFLGFPLAYMLFFSIGLYLTDRPYGPVGVVKASLELLDMHKGANTGFHPVNSRWYTWVIPKTPLTLQYINVSTHNIRGLVALGNPILWWSAMVAVAGTFGLWIRRTYHNQVISRSPFHVVRQGTTLAGAWLVLLWAMPIIPWVFSKRDSYLYHYMPSHCFGMILLAGLLAKWHQRRPLGVMVFVALVAVVAAFYTPIWAQLEVTHMGWRDRLILPPWK